LSEELKTDLECFGRWAFGY